MKNKAAAAAAGPESEYGRSNQLLLNHHATITVIVSSFLLLSAVVDSFRFGAVWIRSTRRLSDVCVVFHCCGFFPLQSRVDSFHSAAQCCPRCLAMLWILSTSEPCGFFPLGDSVVSVLFRDAVDSLDIVIVVMNITVSRSPPPVQLEGMHRRPRTAFTVAIAVAKARLFYRLFTLSSPRLAPPWRVAVSDGCHCLKALSPEPLAGTARVISARPPRIVSDGNRSSSSEQKTPSQCATRSATHSIFFAELSLSPELVERNKARSWTACDAYGFATPGATHSASEIRLPSSKKNKRGDEESRGSRSIQSALGPSLSCLRLACVGVVH